MRTFVGMLLLSSMAVLAAPKTPRPAPELSITMPSGPAVPLNRYRGKVTVVEFLITTCPHCQHAAQLMSKLQNEYGPKGFQSLGVAFNEGANTLVPDFIRDYKVNYPVGYTSREKVYGFLQSDPNVGVHVPQIVIIDRKGVIRHQSLPREDTVTATEKFLRQNIEALLKEPAGSLSPRAKASGN